MMPGQVQREAKVTIVVETGSSSHTQVGSCYGATVTEAFDKAVAAVGGVIRPSIVALDLMREKAEQERWGG